MRRSALLCFWLTVEFAKFIDRQNQSVQLRLIPYMYVCPTSAHWGFRHGYRRYKDNTFLRETTLLSWKSMVSISDLTLLNINMSKDSTFAWFFSLKSSHYQWLFIPVAATESATLPIWTANQGGSFAFMGTLRLYTKQAISISEQIELLKSRGLNIADSSKAATFLGEVSYSV